MLKIVVFDSGYGGELFADYLQENIPIVDIIRVIDWRNSDKILAKPSTARQTAEKAILPYIGRVDLIIFANYLLSITSLKYFQRKYTGQKFLGLTLKIPDCQSKCSTLILTTKAVSRTISYRNYIFRLKCHTKTITLDAWPGKIDDGELTDDDISMALKTLLLGEKNQPKNIILACSQFNDIKPTIRHYFGNKAKIYDSFDDTLREACKILRIRGGIGKKKKRS